MYTYLTDSQFRIPNSTMCMSLTYGRKGHFTLETPEETHANFRARAQIQTLEVWGYRANTAPPWGPDFRILYHETLPSIDHLTVNFTYIRTKIKFSWSLIQESGESFVSLLVGRSWDAGFSA